MIKPAITISLMIVAAINAITEGKYKWITPAYWAGVTMYWMVVML